MAQYGPKMTKDGPKMSKDGPKMAPRWPKMAGLAPRWAQDGPKAAQAGPKMVQAGPKMAPTSPKMAPRWSKSGPRGAQEGPRWVPKRSQIGRSRFFKIDAEKERPPLDLKHGFGLFLGPSWGPDRAYDEPRRLVFSVFTRYRCDTGNVPNMS